MPPVLDTGCGTIICYGDGLMGQVRGVPHQHMSVRLPDDMEWMDQANCIGVDPSVMFPPKGRGTADEAKAICAQCDVRAECLEFALAFPQQMDRHGVFGGKTVKERTLVRKSRRRLGDLR